MVTFQDPSAENSNTQAVTWAMSQSSSEATVAIHGDITDTFQLKMLSFEIKHSHDEMLTLPLNHRCSHSDSLFCFVKS